MKIKHNLKSIAYRMKLRLTLNKASIEELTITKEEIIKEINRRNKKK